jgi:eukaryotic-like serine/threonine-protein kinase
VPSVKGKDLTTAIQLIQSAGLTYKVNNVTSTQPVGTVLDQNPAGGSKVKATVPVVLTVSGTQSSVSVPSVLGQSPASAGSILTHAGLNAGSETNACSSQYAPGLVSGQNPGPNVTVQPNTAVNLVVANGSCASVPNVVGQTGPAAQTLITGAGLVASMTTDTGCANNTQPAGNVDSQSPAANAQVPMGSTVTITVCQPATTTTPPPSSTTSSTTSTTSTTPNNILRHHRS